MIRKPITTEKAIRLIEADNTILFEVDTRKTKKEIKKSVEEIFNVKVENINTCNRGTKKIAYVKLNKKNPAIDVATKLGMI
ncbi:50S ribosomal protein L23 [Candidatus Pacearchaeota archaeon]|nr:50S ribosomal protein L23 [Candidatus Pacearchaeota archaeon]